MHEIAFRLVKGDDIKLCLEEHCKDINTAIVLCGVGCINHVNIRLAKAINCFKTDDDYEIVSLNGTISKGKVHIHIALADENGNVIGGHLNEGCIVNTTCEIILGILEEYESIRKYDESTGYKEIEFKKYE